MATSVQLQVDGIDLENDETAEQIGAHFPEYLWASTDGLVTMTIHIARGDVVAQTVEAANAVGHRIPGARVRRVHRDLVSQSDIAARVGLSREAVRKWSQRHGSDAFPTPFGTVGGEGRPSKVWLWSDVASWLGANYAFDTGDELPDDETVAHIDACLAKVKGYLDRDWQTVTPTAKAAVVGSLRVATRSALEAHLESRMIERTCLSFSMQTAIRHVDEALEPTEAVSA